MEKLAENIAGKIALQLNLDSDNKEVMAYGIFAILDMFLSIILVALFGALFHVAVYALIVSFTASILRKYSGGIHASSPGACVAIGTFVCVGQAVLISFVLATLFSLKQIIISGLLIFIWAFVMVYELAPVDSLAKPIKKQEKRKRMKKGSIIILCAYLLIVMLNIIIYFHTRGSRFISFSLCIYGGIMWQVFTLTRVGHIILGKVDSFFNQILTFIKGGK